MPTLHDALHRARQAANALNGSTLAGWILAKRAGCPLTPGPARTLIAYNYPRRFPAPAAGGVTVGDVILLRHPGPLPHDCPLLTHEARHATQWALLAGVPGFIPAYFLAAGWSLLRCGDYARYNLFEQWAGLRDGGYACDAPAHQSILASPCGDGAH